MNQETTQRLAEIRERDALQTIPDKPRFSFNAEKDRRFLLTLVDEQEQCDMCELPVADDGKHCGRCWTALTTAKNYTINEQEKRIASEAQARRGLSETLRGWHQHIQRMGGILGCSGN